jgi:hypothetical protein
MRRGQSGMGHGLRADHGLLPSGKNVLGGGFFLNVLGTPEVVESAPRTAAGLSGWHVVAFNHSDTVTGHLIAYATCAFTS